jgi:iron complex outermembrane receptor protein
MQAERLLTLEELAETEIRSSGSLTASQSRSVPATVTVIDAEMIRRSGGRNLIEVLDICVPGFSYTWQHSVGTSWGMRGISSDLSEKYLMLVNGRQMNDKLYFGAVPETLLSTLGDIERIEVVRGPGSAMYGSGAIGGVINIITRDSRIECDSLVLRQGALESFSNLELRHSRHLNEAMGYSLYYGIDSYRGADEDAAPSAYPQAWRQEAGKELHGSGVPALHQAYRDLPRHKLMLQLDADEFRSWLRYTRGGEETLAPSLYTASKPLATSPAIGTGYQQLTWDNKWSRDLSDDFNLEIDGGAQATDMEQLRPYTLVPPAFPGEPMIDKDAFISYADYDAYLRTTGRWTPHEDHKLALGGEIRHESYGNPSLGYPHLDHSTPPGFDQWHEKTQAVFGEHQWNFAEAWHLYLGERLDWHPATAATHSPRAGLIFTPSSDDTFKLLYNRSSRRPNEFDIRFAEIYRGVDKLPVETVDSYEFRYERQVDEKLWLGFGAFYNDYEQLGFVVNTQNYSLIGQSRSAGLEAEMTWKEEDTSVRLSHCWTKLLDFELAEPGILQYFSASPYGYGNDFATWPSHLSKIQISQGFNPDFSADASLRILWDFPGRRDQIDYGQAHPNPYYLAPDQDGASHYFGPFAYFDLGGTWRIDPHSSLRLDLYNLLGLIDPKLNRRLYRGDADYRSEAIAAALTYEYRF